MPQAPSPQRGKNGRVEKIGGRGVKKTGRGGNKEKRGRMPERSSTLIRGGSRCRRGTTIVQKLDKDFFAFESSFQRGHEFDRPSASDQEATYPIFALRNSRGASMT